MSRPIEKRHLTIRTKAASELMLDRVKQKVNSDEDKAFGNIKQTADNAYTKVQNMPKNLQESTFEISV
jgi:hypothetical protein